MFFISFILWSRLFRWSLLYVIGFALISIIFYGLFIKLMGVSQTHHDPHFGIIIFTIISIFGIQWYVFSSKLFRKPVNVRGKKWRIAVTENGRLLNLPLSAKHALALVWGVFWRTILLVQGWRVFVKALSYILHDYGIILPAKLFIVEIIMQVLAFWWLIAAAYGGIHISVEDGGDNDARNGVE